MLPASGSSASDFANLARMTANPIFVAYFTALDSAAHTMLPLKYLARAQTEAATFMSRRALSYMAIPAKLASCRSPQDVLTEQRRFWDSAAEQYAQSSRLIQDAWAAVLKPAAAPGSEAVAPPRTHDYIEFPLAKRMKRPLDPVETSTREFA